MKSAGGGGTPGGDPRALLRHPRLVRRALSVERVHSVVKRLVKRLG
jgi:hypothetical protein